MGFGDWGLGIGLVKQRTSWVITSGKKEQDGNLGGMVRVRVRVRG